MSAQTGDVPDFLSIIKLLTGHGIDFIVVGRVAAHLFGSARLTYDLDIVYSRREENLRNIVTEAPSYDRSSAVLRSRWNLSSEVAHSFLCGFAALREFLFSHSRSAVIGLILTARSVGIRQAKVAARPSIIITNAIVSGS
jgi:hypothetical protein